MKNRTFLNVADIYNKKKDKYKKDIMIQDSTMVILTNEEYEDLIMTQTYYTIVNDNVNDIKHEYFVTGYQTGIVNGVIIGFCLIILSKRIKNIISKIKCLKSKKNETGF